jgi:hypothetical protein
MPALNPAIDASTYLSSVLVEHLEQQLRHRFRGLHVRLQGEGLVLQGQVRSYYAKQVAQHLVMRLTDLPIAANEIEVR